ncbi:MAG: DUF2384 domain-containing protein [Bacteroidetes bacterium]|nr:DUF2384 domain-containing protein [Bacteroidota bacterium]
MATTVKKTAKKKGGAWTHSDTKTAAWSRADKKADWTVKTQTGIAVMMEVKGPTAGDTLKWASHLSPISVIRVSEHGLHAKVLKSIQKETGFSSIDLARCLQINNRTLQRYQQKNVLMNFEVSERALLVAQIAEHGREVFGSMEQFRLWLEIPSTALGGISPESILNSITGMQLVKAELGRIEHGVY